MKNEDLEELFAYINAIEDRIQQIEDMQLYEYVVNCLIHNEYATIEDYKDFIEED